MSAGSLSSALPTELVREDQTRNQLLSLLPPQELEQVLRHSELVTLTSKDHVWLSDQPILHVYFPEDAVISLVTELFDGSSVEAMTIGNDGFAGTAIFHEKSSAHCLAVCQITGTLRRLSVTEFRHLIHTTPTLARLLHIYSQFVFEVVSQAAACNRIHHIDQRAARWLLMSADRVGRPRFDLTQEFFAEMLGVRRPGVTQTIGVLTSRKLITHGRGWIGIEDRTGLEAVSCECYEVINRIQRSAFS